MFWFSQYVFIPYQAPYLHSIGTVPSLVGMVVGAYGLSQMLLRIPAGLTADHLGRYKVFILLGIVSSGIASLLRASFPSAKNFLIASLLSGLAAAMWILFMVLFFTYFSSNGLQKATGWIVGANNLGILIGFLTGTFLYDRFGIRFLCLLAAIVSAVAFFLATLIREPPQKGRTLPLRELATVFQDRRLLVFAFIALIQQGIQISTSMSFTTQIAENLGASGFQIGVCSIIYILTAVLSSCFVTTKIFCKIKASIWIPAILACLTVYCILIPNLPTVQWIDAFQVLSGLSTGILFSVCTSEAMKYVPAEKHSSAMGFFQAVYALGMTVFPILTGIISGRHGIKCAFYCLAALAVTGIVGMAAYYRLHPAEK
jgi:predicted MFS family arabinose efflux permease